MVIAVLFAELGSVADEETETVSVMTVPFATPVFTFTISVKVPDVPPAMLAFVQTTFPVPPAPCVRQLHPEGVVIETNVVLVGIGGDVGSVVGGARAAVGDNLRVGDIRACGNRVGRSASVTAKSALEAVLAASYRRIVQRADVAAAAYQASVGNRGRRRLRHIDIDRDQRITCSARQRIRSGATNRLP